MVLVLSCGHNLVISVNILIKNGSVAKFSKLKCTLEKDERERNK